MGTAQSSLDDDSFPKEIKKLTEIRFYLHDKEHAVSTEDVNPNTSLNSYLRNVLHMTGTKAMCLEGGCGSCVVVLQKTDLITKKEVFLAVNSCLVPLLSCNGWRISTIEGIGNPKDGYHPIQEVLANFNGTQCGFCSPGMVMNMYALYESGKLTMEQVEDSFSGNICRCTGYRPILSAFKSLCKDASREVLGECPDMEDFVFCYEEKRAKKCVGCPKVDRELFCLQFPDSKWIKVYTLSDLITTLSLNSGTSYRLVAGNTAQGVYRSYKNNVGLYFDVTDIFELKVCKVSWNSCVVGAGNTLNDTIEFFTETAKKHSQFAYLQAMADQINLIANVPVRNRATLAGNLMIKHDHHDFPSDIFVIMETVGATLTIVDMSRQETNLSPLEFINHDMNHVVLKTITLPSFTDSDKFVSYKIMPRSQNTHAYVNSGFLFKFNNNLVEKATLVYGNINPDFAHATRSEKILQGKNLFDNSTLQQVYSSLAKEVNPDVNPPDPTPQLRKQLAIALFYKGVLGVAPSNKISSRHKSGGEILKRPLSKGTQDYETNQSLYPLTEAIPKLEALAQTSGQAQYIVDLPDLPHQLFGALVLAKAPANSVIRKIDATKALKNEDIVAFFTKDDIPGKNSFTPVILPLAGAEEELFCDGTVKYYDQPLGVLVGKSQEAVNDATCLVQVTYNFPNQEPATSVRQILKRGLTDKIQTIKDIKATRKGNDVKHVIKGTFDIYHQYHVHMETQCCSVVPTENGLDVFSSTQWIDHIQFGIAQILNIPQSRVTVFVRRCGGAFGGKITRAGMPACAVALAAWLLKKPVKIWLPLATNMTAIGKRFPLSSDYEVGVDDKGTIQYLNCSLYNDAGYQLAEDVSMFMEQIFMNTYKSDTFTIHFKRAFTDVAVNTAARGPGSVEGVASIEAIMEHISYAINQDPLEVRLANVPDQSPIAKYIEDIKSWASIDQRRAEVASFNEQNRWKKKGLAVVPMKFNIEFMGAYLALVSICHSDGSVQICHGGVEIGQGINTKVAQICAYKLGIPLEKITVLPSNSFATTNSIATGGSLTTEVVAYAIIQACDELLTRMKPYNSKGLKWEDWVAACFKNNINLVVGGIGAANSPGIEKYSVYGTCATEVLVDILTGQHLVTRVDIIEDAGVALSPMIDIGQVEGAFVMGLGYYTLEKIVFNHEGRVLTDRTWNYLPPLAKDIPINFNIKLPKNNPNPVGVLHAKGIGEPALCLAISIPFAIRNALASARKDASESKPKWYKIDGPTDVENVFLNSLNDYSQYVL